MENGLPIYYQIIFEKGTDFIHDGYGVPVNESVLGYIERMIEKTRSVNADEIRLTGIVTVAKGVQDQLNKAFSGKVSSAKKKKSTYIYLIHDYARGLYKIGISNDVNTRLAQLKTANSEISLFMYFPGTETDEKDLHRIFDYKRKTGEWFELSESDIEYIKHHFSDPIPF